MASLSSSGASDAAAAHLQLGVVGELSVLHRHVVLLADQLQQVRRDNERAAADAQELRAELEALKSRETWWHDVVGSLVKTIGPPPPPVRSQSRGRRDAAAGSDAATSATAAARSRLELLLKSGQVPSARDWQAVASATAPVDGLGLDGGRSASGPGALPGVLPSAFLRQPGFPKWIHEQQEAQIQPQPATLVTNLARVIVPIPVEEPQQQQKQPTSAAHSPPLSRLSALKKIGKQASLEVLPASEVPAKKDPKPIVKKKLRLDSFPVGLLAYVLARSATSTRACTPLGALTKLSKQRGVCSTWYNETLLAMQLVADNGPVLVRREYAKFEKAARLQIDVPRLLGSADWRQKIELGFRTIETPNWAAADAYGLDYEGCVDQPVHGLHSVTMEYNGPVTRLLAPTQQFSVPVSIGTPGSGGNSICIVWRGPSSVWEASHGTTAAWSFDLELGVADGAGGVGRAPVAVTVQGLRVRLGAVNMDAPQTVCARLLGGRGGDDLEVEVRCSASLRALEHQYAVNPKWEAARKVTSGPIRWMLGKASAAVLGAPRARPTPSQDAEFEEWRARRTEAAYAVEIVVDDVFAPTAVLFGGVN